MNSANGLHIVGIVVSNWLLDEINGNCLLGEIADLPLIPADASD